MIILYESEVKGLDPSNTIDISPILIPTPVKLFLLLWFDDIELLLSPDRRLDIRSETACLSQGVKSM